MIWEVYVKITISLRKNSLIREDVQMKMGEDEDV